MHRKVPRPEHRLLTHYARHPNQQAPEVHPDDSPRASPRSPCLHPANLQQPFSRTLRTSGHIFWSAPDNVVEAMVQQMARRLALPDTQVTGEPWPCRQVLPEGDLQRHLQYEWGCRKKRKEPRFIVNLRQNHAFMQSFSEVVPALLTKTSLLWSMQVERMLAPLGHLLVIGRACPQS